MTLAGIFLIVVKVLVVITFLMTMAAVGAWADRRQSAMIQHRVGPNRAVIYLPALWVRVIIVLSTVLVAAAICVPLWWYAPGVELARTTTGIELAILVGWFSLLLLNVDVRKNGADNAFEELIGKPDPRAFFYGGLALHLLALAVVRLIPTELLARSGPRWVSGSAGFIAAIVILSSGFYAAARVADGKVPLRLGGLLHSVADALKMVWKEDLRPRNADKVLFNLAPLLAIFPALVTFAVVPFGSTVCVKDGGTIGELDFADLGNVVNTVQRSGECAAGALPITMQVADLNVGLLYIFAIAGTGIIGAAIAGWSSDNKFALLGGLRATSQMVSYEVAMGLSIVGLLMVVGSVHMQKLVDWQGENTWGIFAQPLGFILFFAAVVAETKRVPFDQPEAESELVAGYFLEYSGMKFGLFMTGEYVEFAFSSALMVTLFFGGYHLPFLHADGLHIAIGDSVIYSMPMAHLSVSIIHFFAFFGKVILFAFFQVFIRWTLPRFRYDQLMKLGWTKLLPLALVNVMLTGLLLIGVDSAGPQLTSVLKITADLTQLLVAAAALIGAVTLITWLLEPPDRKRLVLSSSARYVAAAGGVKSTEMQA